MGRGWGQAGASAHWRAWAGGRWSPALLKCCWGRGWWHWGAEMGSWGMGRVEEAQGGLAGTGRAGRALRALTVTWAPCWDHETHYTHPGICHQAAESSSTSLRYSCQSFRIPNCDHNNLIFIQRLLLNEYLQVIGKSITIYNNNNKSPLSSSSTFYDLSKPI